MTQGTSTTGASRRSLERFIPAYLALLLALAALGGHNQQLLERESTLTEQLDEARLDVLTNRLAAARIDGPLTVAQWAQNHGMVPVPEVTDLVHVLPLPAPHVPVPSEQATRLEVRTRWR